MVCFLWIIFILPCTSLSCMRFKRLFLSDEFSYVSRKNTYETSRIWVISRFMDFSWMVFLSFSVSCVFLDDLYGHKKKTDRDCDVEAPIFHFWGLNWNKDWFDRLLFHFCNLPYPLPRGKKLLAHKKEPWSYGPSYVGFSFKIFSIDWESKKLFRILSTAIVLVCPFSLLYRSNSS